MGDYLYPFQKKHYIKNRKNMDSSKCILCELQKKKSTVPSLIICKTKLSAVCVNLYPYNPGHLMIFPLKHITDIRDLSSKQESEINSLSRDFLNIMEKIYSPSGFNIGYNMGNSSGASIPHIHRHLIPRYINEIGIVELIGGAKVLIEDPNESLKQYMEEARNYSFSIPDVTI